MESDLAIRLAAFRFLEEEVAIHGDVLARSVLSAGFRHEGARVPLVSQKGIFKPRVCRLPLCIRTSADAPYGDAFGAGGLLQYRHCQSRK